MIEKYKKSILKLSKEFVKKYYGKNCDWYIIWIDWDLCPNTLSVNDYFRWIDDIYIALKNNITEDILFSWYDYSLNKATIESEYHNLYHYAFWLYEYTDEERYKDEQKVKESYELLMECIKK
jgi:hypothetical protein